MQKTLQIMLTYKQKCGKIRYKLKGVNIMNVSLKSKVMDWICHNFNLDEIEVTDYPLMPGGCLIKDKFNCELLVWFDFMTQEIKWK